MSIKYDAFKNIAIASYISQSDADNLIDKLNTSINNVNILKELNTDNVEPFIHPFVTISSLRSDTAISQDNTSDLGQISPAFDNNNYIVPIILSKG
jgi:aspartyl/glutamyl-tRNA(Asn/Gln) amidotransferase C subunit